MTSIHFEAQVSADQLLHAVAQLPPPEFERFLAGVKRLPPPQRQRLSRRESELLWQINQGLPAETQSRYAELIEKRRDETLTDEEYQQLLQLTNQAEECDVKRLECLTELAALRRMSLTALLAELEIQAPQYE